MGGRPTVLDAHLPAIVEGQAAIAQASHDWGLLVRVVTEQALALTNATGSALALVDGDYLHVVGQSGSVAEVGARFPLNGSLSAQSLQAGDVLVVRDAFNDPRINVRLLPQHVRCVAVAPLSFGGEDVGVLALVANRCDTFGKGDVATLRLLRGVVGAAMSHARAKADMQAVNQRLSTVLRAVTEVAIIGVDMRGAITFFNEGAERMLGYRADEVVGRMPVLFHDPDEVRQGLAEVGGSAPELFIGPALRGMPHTRDWSYVRKDGSRLVASVTITPMRDASDTLVGFISVSSDVTERRSTERMKDELISIVSHELRTPLTGIRGALGLLAGGVVGAIPPEAQRMLELAVSNTDRLIRLVGDMLDLDQITSGAVDMRLSATNLADLISRATEAVTPVASRTNVQIRNTPLHLRVVADPDRMVQVLTNVLSNAIKFSPPGSTIDVSARRSGNDRVVVTVRDRGPGIPQHELERIFDRFHQVDSSDARIKGGSGLGLTISRAIVERHGGAIWAANAPDCGAVISIELPRARRVDRQATA